MHLRLVTSVWILTSSIAFAQANTLAPLPEHAAGSRSTFSKFKRRCPLPTEEDPNPPCRPPVEPPEPTDPSIHSYTVNDPGIFHKPISIKINVPDTISVETWNDVLLDNLQTTLPTTLKQFNVDASQIPALASEGIPLLVEAITAVHNGLSLPDTDAALARRGLFSKIGRWIKKVVTAIAATVVAVIQSPECAIFSALTLPGYMVADVGFAHLNGYPSEQGVSTTPDQDYFISPLHGSISHNDNIRIFYGAKFFPGFDNAAGVAFGKLIYIKADQSATTANTPLLGDWAFRQKTKLLLHEFTHVKQYRELGYVNPFFGARYLYNYCTAGFSYAENALEKEASTKAEQVNRLLDNDIGTQFFDKWKNNNWAEPFGFPTQTSYTEYPILPNHYYLRFQNGGLTLLCNSARQCV